MKKVLVNEMNAIYFISVLTDRIIERILAHEIVCTVMLDEKEDGTIEPIGAAAIEGKEDTAELIWLYTKPEWRRKGVAAELIHTILDSLITNENIAVLYAFYPDSEASDALDRTFSAIGFKVETDSAMKSFTVADCLNLPDVDEKYYSYIRKLPEVPASLFNDFKNSNRVMAEYLSIEADKWQTTYAPFSRVYIKDGVVSGILLLSEKDNEIIIDYAFIRPDVAKILFVMLNSAIKEIKTIYPDNTSIFVTTANVKSTNLISRLIPSAKTRLVHCAGLDFIELIEDYMKAHD